MKIKNKPSNNVNNQDKIEQEDKSPIIPQRNKIKNELNIRKNFNFTERQKEFIRLSEDKNTKIIFVNGPAGTSKTFISVYSSLNLLNQKKISDIIYIRSLVECSEKSIGYLPGTSDEKFLPYAQPLFDKLLELLPKNEIEYLKKDNRIISIPVGFLRGLNFNAQIIISDESQNMTFKELFTLITRVGEFSKIFILGDDSQSDLNGKSGFIKMLRCFDDDESKDNGIHVFNFTEEDIVRSQLVKYIIKKFNKSQILTDNSSHTKTPILLNS